MAIARSLRALSGVTLVGALMLVTPTTAKADQVRDDQWPLKFLSTEKAWESSKGKGQTVAVIDDGVAADHPDLKGNVLQGKNFIDGGSSTPDSGDNHGTGMASIIAGHGHGSSESEGVKGIAPEAKILPLKDDGTSRDGLADSITYAVDRGVSVINISLGGKEPGTEAEDKAIAHAVHHGIPVVAGTGNKGTDVAYPAAQNAVLAVAGVNEDETYWEKSNRGPQTLLTAPAGKIVSASAEKSDFPYRMASGTSDATAYVSGTLALLRSKFPDLTAGQLVNRLTETAKMPDSMKGANLPDEKYGYGVIQPLAALTEDVPKGPKLGPLSAPKFDSRGNAISGDEPTQAEIDAENAESEREAKIIWTVLGVVGVVFVGLVVMVVVLVRKKKRQNGGSDGPNWPGGPGDSGMPGAYGPVQPQQGMPPVPPQQPGSHPAPPYQPPRS